MTSRAIAFSGKKKKEQLKERRRKKRGEHEISGTNGSPELGLENKGGEHRTAAERLVSDWDVSDRISSKDYYKSYNNPINDTPPLNPIINVSEFYQNSSLDIPCRPAWTKETSRAELEASEERHFKNWIGGIYSQYPPDRLGFFEQNLEVWRQFWRVCEMADVLIVVVDSRFPIFHYPLSIHRYLKDIIAKPFIIVFMKADLVPPNILNMWKCEMGKVLGDNIIIEASVYESDCSESPRKRYRESRGVDDVLTTCEKILESEAGRPNSQAPMQTLGLIGHPNVGKSSLINSLIGRKVVSTSKTPGHTKHFQTINWKQNLRLCDCPGLIFPSLISRDLQALHGLYNIAQLSNPYGPLMEASQVCDLRRIFGLNIPGQKFFSVFELCEAMAIKEGYYTSGAGRPDTYRAANLMLRKLFIGSPQYHFYLTPLNLSSS